ncbi:hypothetical protein ACFVT2_09875 [Streptomyces sp. NPDC058000]|uniref:hypothetical protein n=1 Tax=Streptomyces sp. NPDC058000 TaxID=3346299 RepID=UPI0036E3873F
MATRTAPTAPRPDRHYEDRHAPRGRAPHAGPGHHAAPLHAGPTSAPGPLGQDAAAFGAELLARRGPNLSSAIVVDTGRTDGHWAAIEAIEANAAWASGSCTADPEAALDTDLRAAGPRSLVAERDLPFVRRAG